MERFVKGDVVILPFPFTDLSGAKRRPALVLANLHGDDIILCQITSKMVFDKYAIELSASNFSHGSLNHNSNIRPNRIFTADQNLISRKAGTINQDKMNLVTEKIISILKG